MIRHWTTLQRIADELSSILSDARFVCAWSQAKDTAHIEFEKGGEPITLEVLLQSDIGTVVVTSAVHRARRNTVDLFRDVTGERVIMVTRQLEDRIITIWLESAQLHFELFPAGTANIILTRAGLITDAFRHRQQRIGTSCTTRKAVRHNVAAPSTVREYLEHEVPNLGRLYALEVIFSKGLTPDTSIADAPEQTLKDLIQAAQSLFNFALTTNRWLILEAGNHIALSAVPLHGYHLVEEHDAILTAVHKTIVLRQQRKQLEDTRSAARIAIERRLNKTQRTLQHLQQDEERDRRASTYRHWAELLMAQPNPKYSGVDQVEVIDWLTNETVVVPLKKDISILANATRYFQKAKDADTASAVRTLRIPRLENDLKGLTAQLELIRTATTVDELRQFTPTMNTSSTAGRTSNPEEKYRVFQLDEQHTLYVGKSAANNDELTMKFARQQDWWFHVRGASGSHAVLRGVAGPKIPKDVLEKVASITAYYSHARNAGFVPVVYTQRKYVRKPKGANVGAVTIEREQTIMVKPGLPSEFRTIE